ncbi:RNA polymerase II subunit A C-terminal domain phosphatase [Pimephales promelas]|nr:RNA polymerase II subunit A C-terminal domain phosphatase [Pimephales promelas]KAG1947435.1 RNA polymerase II subunit A C-terminal domain phosphatase [Pimephales promelas]
MTIISETLSNGVHFQSDNNAYRVRVLYRDGTGFLDPEKKLFSHRIMSRDECIDPYSKTGNLRNLFPCGDSMVCIIDDREDVWKFAPNLITVKKYIYFQGTGDINAPPGSREAQMAKKGSQAGRPSENLESSGQEEQRNGLRKSSKDRKTGHEELSSVTTTTQGASANERTHSTGESESRDDKCNVKTEGEGSSGVTSTSGETDFPNTAANDLDFDLSSDSESEGKMGLSDSDGEGQPVDAGKTKQTKTEECKIKEDDGDKPRTEGDDIPETDPEGLGDLGNGCSDKKEVETESQNSEQSAVTMGEESLDHSMEDEDDEEEEDIDQDDHLIYLEEVLVRIHTEYYSRYEAFLRKESSETPDIRKIVPELKGRTLEGATIIFSGLYPTNYPMERTREWYHAKALGAKIGKTLVLNDKDPNRTTHLIAARAGTEKVRQAQDCKHLHVVNPDWLWGCLERWERIEEQLFPLKEDYNKSHRSSSPAAFLDLQGSVPRPLFQAPPVQHKSLAPPEMRTYDPVTGKLIRRGPQASRPPSYLRSHGSSMSTKGDMSTLRSGQGSQERDAAAGSSADDEQPGPSRRKRQPSMSESMPLYTLCKEDLDSMDKEVDDMLGEESDNESDGKGKERMEAEEDEEERLPTSKQKAPSSDHGSPLATVVEENAQTSTREDASVTGNMFRGCKRKLEEARDDNDDDEDCGGSSKDSNEEGSSSEADEMAAALDAELNDFIIERLWKDFWTGVTHVYYDVLHSLEEDGSLDISDNLHLFCAQYTFLPRLKADLAKFSAGWNAHPIRTEGFLTPNQLWEPGMLQHPICEPEEDVAGIQIEDIDWESSGLSHNSANTGVAVPEMECPLKTEDIETLRLATAPLSHSNNFGRDIYLFTLAHALYLLRHH